MLEYLKDGAILLNFALIWLIFPVMKQIRASNTRNDAVLKKLDEISQINHEIVKLHHRTERIEEAILFLTDNKDMKAVVKLLRRSPQNEDKRQAVS